eukprot:441767-Rhodomonas_salina.10
MAGRESRWQRRRRQVRWWKRWPGRAGEARDEGGVVAATEGKASCPGGLSRPLRSVASLDRIACYLSGLLRCCMLARVEQAERVSWLQEQNERFPDSAYIFGVSPVLAALRMKRRVMYTLFIQVSSRLSLARSFPLSLFPALCIPSLPLFNVPGQRAESLKDGVRLPLSLSPSFSLSVCVSLALCTRQETMELDKRKDRGAVEEIEALAKEIGYTAPLLSYAISSPVLSYAATSSYALGLVLNLAHAGIRCEIEYRDKGRLNVMSGDRPHQVCYPPMRALCAVQYGSAIPLRATSSTALLSAYARATRRPIRCCYVSVRTLYGIRHSAPISLYARYAMCGALTWSEGRPGVGAAVLAPGLCQHQGDAGGYRQGGGETAGVARAR